MARHPARAMGQHRRDPLRAASTTSTIPTLHGEGIEVDEGEFSDGLAEALDRHCARLGDVQAVVHEMAFLQWPKIHVHIHRATPVRPWVTLRTEGMSEEPLSAPEDAQLDRLELLMYVPGEAEDDVPDWMTEVVRFAAHLVHDSQSHYVLFDSLQFTMDGEPIEGTPFAGGMVRVPVAEPPGWDLMPHLDGVVRFLELVLLTSPELEYKLAHGGAAIDDRLGKLEVPGWNDVARRSVISD